MNKRFLNVVFAIMLVIALLPAMTIDARAERISSNTDSRITTMLASIDSQNWNDSSVSAEDAKNVIKHFLYDSTFAAISGGRFPHSNSGNFVYSVKDNVYTQSITGAKGCAAYSRFVSKCLYGTEALNSKVSEQVHTADTLKTLLQTYAQAGEQIRVAYTHSMTFISCDNNGVYVMEYLSQNIVLNYHTYSDIIKEYPNKKMWLYDANKSINGTSTATSPPTNENKVPGTNNTITLLNETYYVAKDGVPVRATPYATDTILERLIKNTPVTVTGRGINSVGNLWCKVSINGQERWIFSDNLTSNTPVSAKDTTDKCKHPSYTSSGYCTTCGADFEIRLKSLSGTTYYAVKNDVPVRARPYASDAILGNLKKDEAVTVVGSGYNSQNNLWYKLNDGNWVFSDNLTSKPSKPSSSTVTPTPEPSREVEISFNANGGTGGPKVSIKTGIVNGVAIFTLPTTVPTMKGYDFLGWRLENNTAYGIDKAGQSIQIEVAGGTTLTYYAQWSPKQVGTPPSFSSVDQVLSPGTVGSSYKVSIPINGTGPFTWSLSGRKLFSGEYDTNIKPLPPGLSLNTSTGEITGKPSPLSSVYWGEDFTFTIRAENSAGFAVSNITIHIDPAPLRPTISTTTLPEGKVGVRYGDNSGSHYIAASGSPMTFTYRVVSGELPPGLSLSADGAVIGTPSRAGTFTFTIRVENTAGATDKQFTVVIR